MRKLLHNLRQKSPTRRKQIAFVTSGVVVAGIAAIWISTFSSGLPLSSAEVAAKKDDGTALQASVAGGFNDLKEILNNNSVQVETSGEPLSDNVIITDSN